MLSDLLHRPQGLCSGEGVQLAPGALPQLHRTHGPGRTHTWSHGPQYKYFISITIVPHQNYSSTKHDNTKNRFPAPNPTSTSPRRSQPCGSPGPGGGGLSEDSCPALEGEGGEDAAFVSIPAGPDPPPPASPLPEAMRTVDIPFGWTLSPWTPASGWEAPVHGADRHRRTVTFHGEGRRAGGFGRGGAGRAPGPSISSL